MAEYQDLIIELIDETDLSVDMKFIAETAGIDSVKALIKNCSGTRVNISRIPKNTIKRFFERNKSITWDSKELKKIASSLNLSERYILEIAREKIHSKEQTHLFD